LSKIAFGNGFGFWNTIPTRARSCSTSMPPPLIGSSSSRISPVTRAPGIASFMRLKQRRSVDFPHPDGPISAVTSSRVMSRSTSWMAWLSP
jgi:hypothetical protein